LIGAKGSSKGSLDGSAKGSSKGSLDGSAKGSFVRAKVGSLGGSLVGLVPDGTVVNSFGTPLMFTLRTVGIPIGIPIGTPLWFTSRTPLRLIWRLLIDSMWLILRSASFPSLVRSGGFLGKMGIDQ
jgi:hypothetical protein